MDKVETPFFEFNAHGEAEETMKADRYVLLVHGTAEEISRAHSVLAGSKALKAA